MPRKSIEAAQAAPKDPKVLDKEHKETFAKIPDEELKVMQDEFLQAQFANRESKPPEEKKPEKLPEAEKKDEPKPADKKDEKPPEKATETTGKEKVAPEPKSKKKPLGGLVEDENEPTRAPAASGIDVNLDDEETVEDRLVKLERAPWQPGKPVKQPEPEPDIDLTEEDQEQLRAAEWLVKNEPRFKGRELAKEVRTFWTREDAYAKRWRKEHPDEEFDPAALEHREFYQKNPSPITTRDLDKGVRGLSRDEAAQEGEKRAYERIAPEIQELKTRERIREEGPKIHEARRTALAELAALAVPEFKDLIPGADGKKIITKETYDKMVEANPVAVQFLDEESHILKAQIEELETLRYLGDVIQPDREKEVQTPRGIIRPVSDIAQAGITLEQRILAQPESEREWNGKKFAPRAALQNRIQSIAQSNVPEKEKRTKIQQLIGRFWTIDTNDIRDYLIAGSAQRVKSIISRIPKQDKKPEKKDENLPSNEQQRIPTKPKQDTPPSSASSSDSVNTDTRAKSNTDNQMEEVAKGMGW